LLNLNRKITLLVNDFFIAKYETLKDSAIEVAEFDDSLKDLVAEMFVVMKKENGIGLAAPQIDISKRIVTIDISASEKIPKIVVVNPKIAWSSDDLVPYEEGCLSVPGIFEEVVRPSQVVVQALDVEGKEVEYKADGLLARVLQHEIDHLNGVLFIDHLEEYIRKEYTKELKKIRRMNR
jgi:peptide deformylase